MSEQLQMSPADFLALANAAAEVSENMTEAQESGGNYGRLLPEGWALGRFVHYIDFGNQPQDDYAGKAKADAHEFEIGFALYGQNPAGEKFQNEDGTPYLLRSFPMTRKRDVKSNAFKLFAGLNYTGRYTHFAQLLTQAFLVRVAHKQPKDTTKKPYAIVAEIRPAIDPVTGQPYAVPEARAEDMKVFIWEKPTAGTWNSLAIEGVNETTGKSKNFIQERILSATNFAGSPLQELLGGIPGLPRQEAAAAPATPTAGIAAPPAAAPAVAPVAGVQTAPLVQTVAVSAPVVVPTPGSAVVAGATPVSSPATVAVVPQETAAVASPVVAAPLAPSVAPAAALPASPVQPSVASALTTTSPSEPPFTPGHQEAAQAVVTAAPVVAPVQAAVAAPVVAQAAPAVVAAPVVAQAPAPIVVALPPALA